jgi:GMP synthase (glutamine-hydrolysing)
MHVLGIVHQSDAGPGVFEDVLYDSRAEVLVWSPADEPAPGTIEGISAILTFGGAMHADQADRHPWLDAERDLLRRALDARVPLLGVCLGSQLVAQAAGAVVRRAPRAEVGWHPVAVLPEAAGDPLLDSLAPGFDAFQWHSYEFSLPPDAVPLARSEVCLQAFRIGSSAWGIQFHAEVSATDAQAWIADAPKDADAVAAGVDEAALREQTEQSIDDWNEAGRALCGRFLRYSGVM